MEDRELVQKLLAKDPDAQRYFYEAYRDYLYQTSVYLLGYKDRDAEDMVHETFLRVLQKLSTFEFRSSLGWWMNQICVYLCYKQLRRRKRLVAQMNEELDMLSAPLD